MIDRWTFRLKLTAHEFLAKFEHGLIVNIFHPCALYLRRKNTKIIASQIRGCIYV